MGWNFEGSLAGEALVDTDGTAVRCDLAGADQLGIEHKTKSQLMADGVTLRRRFLLNTGKVKKKLVLQLPSLPVAKVHAIEAAINAAMAAFSSFRLQGTNASRTVDLAVSLDGEFKWTPEEWEGYVAGVEIPLEVDGEWEE